VSAFGIESRMEAVAAFLSERRGALVEREADVSIRQSEPVGLPRLCDYQPMPNSMCSGVSVLIVELWLDTSS
jgi:hypothetical protein